MGGVGSCCAGGAVVSCVVGVVFDGIITVVGDDGKK